MEFVADFIGVVQDNTTLALRPEISCAVMTKKDDDNKTRKDK